MGRGHKVCPTCGAKTGPRARHCPNGHGFTIQGVKYPDRDMSVPTTPKPSLGLGRGVKVCPVCGDKTGLRAKFCHNGHGFTIKGVSYGNLKKVDTTKQIHHTPHIDWHTLQPGDTIKVKGGPVYPLISPNGVVCQEPMGYKGIFRVKYLEHNGILAYPINRKNRDNGACLIYCGEPSDTPNKAGLLVRPHHIVKVRKSA